MYRLDLPREEADAVLVSADMDVEPVVTLHTFGHVRNSTDDHWVDVVALQHGSAKQRGRGGRGGGNVLFPVTLAEKGTRSGRQRALDLGAWRGA